MTPEQIKELIAELSAKLTQLNDAYYNVGESEMDDATYDVMMNQLMDLEQQYPEFALKDSPAQRVGGSPTELFENVRHKYPMLSLSNLYSETDLKDWVTSVQNRLDQQHISAVCEVKIDGFAISITYENGILVQAITRGNGEVGDDVTANVKTIRTLPLKLETPVSLIIRGEIYLPKAQFEKINVFKENKGEALFKNPRNAAAGTVRLKDPKLVAQRGLDILLYDIVEGQQGDQHFKNLDTLKNLGLPVNPYREVCHSAEEIFAFCNYWQEKKDTLPFEIDGVVIKLESLPDRRIMGFTAKTPRWATAWKFKAEKATTRIVNIEDSIGRTGILTPVANLEPVQLLGTEVKRATLHNYEQIERLGIHQGDTVFVEKGGDIIPKIVGVDYGKRKEQSESIKIPSQCPICTKPLTKLDDEVDLRCVNQECPAIIKGALEHFVSKKGLNIQSLGTAIVTQFIDRGMIRQIPDIFELFNKKEQLLALDGFGEKSVNNLLAAIEESKFSPLNQYIYAFGIRHIGEKAAKSIATEIKGLTDFLNLTSETLDGLKDFGTIMNQSLLVWLENEGNRQMIQRLIDLGVSPVPLTKISNQPFENTTIVITGTLTVSRSEWKKRLEELGFKVASSLSKKSDYLLAGEKAGSKLEKAKNLGVDIVNEEEINRIISEKIF